MMKLEKTLIHVTISLLILLIITPATVPQEQPLILVGYGEGKLLPFVSGSSLTFKTGESLSLLSVNADTVVKLLSPEEVLTLYELERGVRRVVKVFGDGDEGIWTLMVSEDEKMKIKVEKAVETSSAYLRVSPMGGLRIRVAIAGASIAGFPLSDGGDVVAAGERLRVPVRPGTMFARLELYYPEKISLVGSVGGVFYSYEVDAIIGIYTVMLNQSASGEEASVEIEMPRIGEVGPRGIIPLRLGRMNIKVLQTGPGASSITDILSLLFIPENTSLPSLRQELFLRLDEAASKPIDVLYLNATEGAFRRLQLKLPIYRLMIYDLSLGRYIEEYEINAEGMSKIKLDETTYLIPSIIRLFGAGEREEITVEAGGKIYSMDADALIGPLRLSTLRPTIIEIESREVEILVRHASGFEVAPTDLMINSTSIGSPPARITLRLPLGLYNFTAITDIGSATKTIDITSEGRVELVIRSLTSETSTLIFISIALLSALTLQVIRLSRLRRLIHRVE